VPANLLNSVRIFGMQDIRTFSGSPSGSFKEDFVKLLEQEKNNPLHNPIIDWTYSLLAIRKGGTQARERRSLRRYSVVLAAEAVLNGRLQRYQGVVTDISFSGGRFVCGETIKKNQKLGLILIIEDQEVALKAMVVRAKVLENLEGVQHGMKVFGVAFEGNRKKLGEFFRKIQQENT